MRPGQRRDLTRQVSSVLRAGVSPGRGTASTRQAASWSTASPAVPSSHPGCRTPASRTDDQQVDLRREVERRGCRSAAHRLNREPTHSPFVEGTPERSQLDAVVRASVKFARGKLGDGRIIAWPCCHV
jgi:hypothetical protein